MAEDSIVPNASYRKQLFTRQGEVASIVFGVAPNTTESCYNPRVIKGLDGIYRMYYTAYSAGNVQNIAMIQSTDLINWTVPSLGFYPFPQPDGSTANNLVYSVNYVRLQFTDIMVDPTWGLYVMSVRNDSQGGNFLLTSTDGFTFVGGYGTAFNGSTGGAYPHPEISPGAGKGHVEIKSTYWHPVDRKWRINYVDSHGLVFGGARSIGYYDSASLSGPWVNRGHYPEFVSPHNLEQYYDIAPFYYKGKLWAAVNIYRYNGTVDDLTRLRLYRSDNHGDTWIRSGTDLLQRSPSGSWDWGLTTCAKPFLVDGVWYLFYGGKTAEHWDPAFPPITVGLATAVENAATADILRINDTRVIGNGSTIPWNAA